MDEPGSNSRPELIAHRGYPRGFPENTLAGLEAALAAGARHVEFDVQLSGDGVPVLFHDQELDRIAGIEGAVTELPVDRLRELDLGEPTRFGDRFRGTRICTVAEAAALLAAWPAVTVFVDVKRQSLAQFGLRATVSAVWRALGPIRPRCVFTCRVAEALAEARDHGAASIAWVLAEVSNATWTRAVELAPQYLVCDRLLLPDTLDPLWPGPWRWAVYGIDRADDALALARRGAHMIETPAILELLRELHPDGDGHHAC